MNYPSRRSFIGTIAFAFGAGALGITSATAEAENPEISVDGNRKFYVDGKVKSFGGNTIICHLPQQGADNGIFNAMLDIYRDAGQYGFLRNATLLPPSSYHMTIIGLCTETGRGKRGQWSQFVPNDAPLSECNNIIAKRLKDAALNIDTPIRMRVDTKGKKPGGVAITIPLVPFDAAEEMKLRNLRKKLSEITGVQISEPDKYQFHISLAYWINKIGKNDEEDFIKAHKKWCDMLNDAVPIINLNSPEFCIFEDMFAFNRQFYL